MKYERSILKLYLKYTSHSVQNQLFIGLRCETLFRRGKLTLGYKNLVRANFSRWGKINKFRLVRRLPPSPAAAGKTLLTLLFVQEKFGLNVNIDPVICSFTFLSLKIYHCPFQQGIYNYIYPIAVLQFWRYLY